MLGRVIDMDGTDAFITFQDGTTIDINLSRLPNKVKVGETIDIPWETSQLKNDKLNNLFFWEILWYDVIEKFNTC